MSKFIQNIHSPKDLKKLSYSQLDVLCEEIRDTLVETVSKCGGHLASNLGAVELTVALHRVLDAPKDKIVWDVGHQSYVHKILTGRLDELGTIRQGGGLCGFCSPAESEYDAAFTGHASASLSTALGMVEARNFTKETYEVATLIGDGSFAGGLSMEAINSIGNLKPKMLIILNDNEMSISKNVGAFSTYLAKVRTNPKYTALKQKTIDMVHRMPDGDGIYKVLKGVKSQLKKMLAPNIFFEQLGVTYLGPVDGHNIKDIEEMLKRALTLNEPVMVHVITKKGKGYPLAEKNPQLFHGIGPFDRKSGKTAEAKPSFSSVFGDEICSLAEKNEKIAVITPAMIQGSGLVEFARRFPDKIYDVGISEGHAVTFAAGLANGGAVPVVAIYSTFLQRAYDNVVHDVALGNYHVVFAIDRAGFVAGDGATHQGLFDLSYLTSIPNMTVLAPSSFAELRKMLDYAVNRHNGPIAIRYPRGSEAEEIDNGEFVLSKAKILKDGSDVTIVAEGHSCSDALRAARILQEKSISAEVIDVCTVKPIDFDTIFASAQKTGRLFCIEQNALRGGMGEMLAAEAQKRKMNFDVILRAVPDEFVSHATDSELREKYGFTPEKIAQDVERMYNS